MKTQDQQPPATVIQDDGLRYKRKAAGSPFSSGGGSGMHQTTMSCFKCGTHRPRAELTTKRLLGKNQLVCAAGCNKTR
ncbi:hypothetical protein [uncultured Azohydromonas sp.]|jgi:hypothetical protein|uniref:hypothetical protein n=1 Tax=uncultured Azohydromonas sp. TaxID=487342 RepID=UPI002609609A|nr:hypothetical protein [uncultured Azohydromonas sp.]